MLMQKVARFATNMRISVTRGKSAGRPVLLGFAAAKTLHSLSFADVLDEATGRGYQRRFSSQHSQDFRRYIQKPNSSTIPLTFNLRPDRADAWRVTSARARAAYLEVLDPSQKILAQVDCQHRLGYLMDLDVELPFMCFIGLTDREEMEVFNIINSKAKGLSTSLLDFHEAQLTEDLASDRPEIFIALLLRNDSRSPWHHQLDLGGNGTSGMTRRASLRTMQKAVKRFLKRAGTDKTMRGDEIAPVVLDFWRAVASTLSEEWSNRRKHVLTKGVGVYALMDVAADIYLEAQRGGQTCDVKYFSAALADFAVDFDWTNDGPLKGLGGEGGAKEAASKIRDARRSAQLRLAS